MLQLVLYREERALLPLVLTVWTATSEHIHLNLHHWVACSTVMQKLTSMELQTASIFLYVVFSKDLRLGRK